MFAAQKLKHFLCTVKMLYIIIVVMIIMPCRALHFPSNFNTRVQLHLQLTIDNGRGAQISCTGPQINYHLIALQCKYSVMVMKVMTIYMENSSPLYTV